MIVVFQKFCIWCLQSFTTAGAVPMERSKAGYILYFCSMFCKKSWNKSKEKDKNKERQERGFQ